ncbi:MAG: DUF2029 domain-containing protein [Afipia sp.]|nr:DUF2029 domain-containing protein [Afipia sp.]
MADFWRSLIAALRTGDWLTAERARAYCAILLTACVLGFGAWIAMSDRMIDRNGKPIGTDFSDPYAAGQLAWAGRAADAYEPALQHAAEKAVFDGRDVPFYGWHYPPFFFAIAAAVAAVPYAWGLFFWLGLSLAAYVAVLRAILPRKETLLIALAFPAVFVNVGHGQNGFLTAALLGSALQLMDRRPWLSGVLIGMLAYKPQFGVLIPLALLVSQRWITIAAAAATVAALVIAATAALGMKVWHAFFASTAFTQSVVLEQGGTGWEKIQSIFSAVRSWGFGIETAYAAQISLALVLAAGIIWLWRSEAAFELKASALATASLLATPYMLDYDMVVLAVSIAFFTRHGFARGFQPFEISILAFAWIAPLISRSIANMTFIPLGLIAMLMLYAITLRRAASDLGYVRRAARKFAQA